MKKTNRCIDCGIEISRRSIRCNPCAHKGEHNPNWHGGDQSYRKEKVKGKVIITGDWHLSLKGALYSGIIYNLACNEWEGKPVLLMGDLCDFGVDRGMAFENEKNPGDQIKVVKQITDLLDVRAYVLGNHCMRMAKAVGLNPYELFLGEERNRVTIDGVDFLLYHGKSAAQDIWSEFRKMLVFSDADCIVMGHNHTLSWHKIERNKKEITFIRSGSFVDHPEYAQRGGYAPAISGYAEFDTRTRTVQLYRVYKDGCVKEW